MAIRGTIALLPVQLVIDRLLGQPEDLTNAILEPLRLLDQARFKVDLQIYACPRRAIIVVGNLATDADVRFQGHVALLWLVESLSSIFISRTKCRPMIYSP